MADESVASRPKPAEQNAAPAQKPAAPMLKNVSRAQGVPRKPRKRRFPWARFWVWIATVVAIGFMVAFVLKVLV